MAQTYFAVVNRGSGYVLDAYPEERISYARELGRTNFGEFPTHKAAHDAIMSELESRTRWLRKSDGRPNGRE